MADKLKDLVDDSVQAELSNLANQLIQIRDLITTINSSAKGFRMDPSTGNQKQAIDDLTNANNNFVQSQKNVAQATQQVVAAQKLQEQTTQTAATRMQGLTENSKLLKQALDDVKKQLQDGISAGKLNADQQERLGQQVSVLTTLVNQQQKGFSSLTAEIRAGERALQTMREAGLQNTTEFKALQLQTAETRREFNNFAKEQRILSSEAPAIQALTTAARGLGGAYAAGAGAAALFGDENGKIQKEFEKLVAIMTLLKGLEEFNLAWQQKNAIATSINVMWNKALTVVYGEEAVAASTAAEATGVLYTVMSAGLILVIGAVIAGIVKLVSVFSDWAHAEDTAAEKAAKVAEANKKVTEAIKEREEIYKMAAEQNKKALEEELSAAEKSGKNQYEILALKRKISEFDKQSANEAIARNAISAKSLTDAKDKWFDAANQVKFYADQISELTAKGEKIPELLTKQSEAAEKNASAIKAQFDLQKEIWDKKQKAEEEIANQEAEKAKLSAEEQRKFAAQVAKERIDAAIHANEQILNNEASTQAQRLQAEKNITAENIKLIRAEAAERLKDPSLTPTGRAMVEDAANAAIAKARIEGKEKLQKINDDYAKRDLKAYYDLRNAMLETLKNTDQDIINNEANSLQKRIEAKENEIGIEQQLETNKYQEAKAKKGLTDNELVALEAAHNTKMLEIADRGAQEIKKMKDDADKKLIEAAKKAHEALINAQKDANTNDSNSRVRDQANAYAALGQQFLNGEISAKKYADAKGELDSKFAIDNIKAEIEAEEKLAKTYDAGSKERLAIDAKVAELGKKLFDAEIKQDAELAKKKKDKIDEILHYEKEGAELVQSIVDGQFEKRKNQLQHEIDLIDQRKETEIAAINASTLNQQQKAAQLLITEQTAAAQKEKLQRAQRQEDIKKAQFDKDAAALQVVANTAAAIMKAVAEFPLTGGMPFAAIVGAEGAIQLATILARPVPKYAEGTSYHPGGLALVGEEYKPELIQSGSHSFVVDKPTLLNLPKGASVTPEDELIAKSLGVRDISKSNSDKVIYDLQMHQTLKSIDQAIRKQKQPVINISNDADFQAHINMMVRN